MSDVPDNSEQRDDPTANSTDDQGRYERASAAIHAFVSEWKLSLNPEDVELMALAALKFADSDANLEEIDREARAMIAVDRTEHQRMSDAMQESIDKRTADWEGDGISSVRMYLLGEMPVTLAWRGDEVIDIVRGKRLLPDGTIGPIGTYYPYRFDRVLTLPDCPTAVLYEALGTKAALVRDDQVYREVDRSWYSGSTHEFPIAIGRVAGQEVIVHCPDGYNRLRVDVLESGEELTARPEVEGTDFFHSRLQISPTGKHLLSAGWMWHPLQALMIYDLETALEDPTTLDGPGLHFDTGSFHTEVMSAAFLDDDRILVALNEVIYPGEVGHPIKDEDEELDRIDRHVLGTWSISKADWLAREEVGEPIGTMMVAGDYVVGFYGEPKLIDIASGNIIHRWRDMDSGKQKNCMEGVETQPPLALDPTNRRFAIANGGRVTVLELDASLTERRPR